MSFWMIGLLSMVPLPARLSRRAIKP
jgi:hypothetical protein